MRLPPGFCVAINLVIKDLRRRMEVDLMKYALEISDVRCDYLRDCDFRRFAGTPLRLFATDFGVLVASNNSRNPCANNSTAFPMAPSCPTRTIATDRCKNGGDRDYYTGLPLDWSRIGVYDNESAKEGRAEYLKSFGNLPTVDHVIAQDGSVKFVICSWRVNDCKSHLSEPEFLDLCARVLSHCNARNQKAASAVNSGN